MATSTESNPPAKDNPAARTADRSGPAQAGSGAARPAGSGAPKANSSGAPATKSSTAVKDAKGLSALSEMNLEKSILRRGLATQQEIDFCKAQRSKLLAEKDESRGLLEVMIAAKALTQNQAIRLLKEIGETQKKLDIPGYQILEKLGKGSMGMVYKAKQTSVDRIVALKVLLDALAQNKEFIKRFEREAKIAAKLSHNNIVNAIDAGEVGGFHYFVMEYVEGETIKDVLERNEVYDEKLAIKIILAVAEALKHAHERGLIHRDIKPENIILTKDGNVKLADLGLARLTADEKWAMAEAGMAIGTPYYISPEQVRGQVDVDIRADIYSLGATLYHMVTGRVPYDGETPAEVMKKHVDKNCQLTPPDHLNTRLSSGLGEVVETMMAKNRENRYRNPDDLILDLKCLLQGERPMIAYQKAESLAGLAEGEAAEGEVEGSGIPESEMVALAGLVHARNTVIAALGVLLALSVVTNIVFLTLR
jgi:serine/threonine-protein kinase